ncbi:HlyD family efflux transporter periplasmic adaptor subunit [Staphylococcus gallinarum]|jgi:multidrug resistance efflux pump|uniref:HlyD family secretion protein n=3 Tax=Staphylococcus gallinarum TaxID=1293 RepID=A0A0D0SPV7_STAGA|nr:HlyD family efflux transporter periplasmic adaptor subunit [Staphylococcus gallinarum]KIR11269.1 multidrug effluc protein [Staphylococcus gallinarum]MBU7217109.1 HlyD family efflux transporter periplasmic adaptor subunit [Staphylococcus gallinarum]MCD8785051.1 HlyD family efflux transporter periplasmic adaptor subunit [Staphylococcus gallinarum]MCD8792674.1 HlyD family efflux transporter periplasmic adaptor subunit [Staphylococcus gallinarum]MCD8821464.1 HlyD family efflux transporter perip
MKKMVLINVITIVVLVILGVVGFHFYNQATSYVSTDNAKVDGEQIKVSAPASGEIKSFDVKNDEKVDKGDKVAKIAVKGDDGQAQTMSIKMPQNGTIVKTDAMEGSMVQAGSPIAYAYNLDDSYITANVDEKDIADVEEGKDVDVKLDGEDAKLKGKVEEVGKATASSFSLMPSSNSDGNYTKVSQVVPVKISLDSKPSKNVVPGMNAEVKIHKN